MLMVYTISEEMKKAREKKLNELVERQNASIDRARKFGKTQTVFQLYSDDQYYSDLRRMYENAGYVIKPTGTIGGIWQKTMDICW